MKLKKFSLAFLSILIFCQVVFSEFPDKNIVANGGFETIDASSGIPTGWKTSVPRDEIAPEFKADNSVSHSGKFSFRTSSKGSAGTFGALSTIVEGITSSREEVKPESSQTIPGSAFLSGSCYLFGCWFRTDQASPEKSVWISHMVEQSR